MPNPFNPLEWVRLAQDWFRRTERSSGFRPYLIFLCLLLGLALVLIAAFPEHPFTKNTLPILVEVSVFAFIVFFGIKALQDPDFCRSEKHIETVKRIAVAEQKGDDGPRVIEDTAEVIPKPKLLADGSGDAEADK